MMVQFEASLSAAATLRWRIVLAIGAAALIDALLIAPGSAWGALMAGYLLTRSASRESCSSRFNTAAEPGGASRSAASRRR